MKKGPVLLSEAKCPAACDGIKNGMGGEERSETSHDPDFDQCLYELTQRAHNTACMCVCQRASKTTE